MVVQRNLLGSEDQMCIVRVGKRGSLRPAEHRIVICEGMSVRSPQSCDILRSNHKGIGQASLIIIIV